VPVAIFAAAVLIYTAVAAQDLRQRQVSNLFCAGIAGLGIIRWAALMQIGPAAWAVAVAVILFGLGVLLFSRGWLGGGDVKLISATALLLGGGGLDDVLAFLFLMSIIGSALALAILARRYVGRFFGAAASTSDGPAAAVTDLSKVPYAVAVAVAASVVLFLQIQRA